MRKKEIENLNKTMFKSMEDSIMKGLEDGGSIVFQHREELDTEELREQIILNITKNVDLYKTSARDIIETTEELIEHITRKRNEINERIFKKEE